jgi:hypothetical protein
VNESRPVEVQGENLDAAGDPDTCIGVGEQTWNSEPWISRKKRVAKVSFGRINVKRVLAFNRNPYSTTTPAQRPPKPHQKGSKHALFNIA